MRATLRITWLLLSLSFLFHCICSQAVNSSVTTAVTESNTTKATTAVTSGPPSTAGTTVQTAAPTVTIAATMTTPMVSTSMPANKTATTQPQVPTVTKTPPTSISGATHVVDKTTATPSLQGVTKLPVESNSSTPEPPQTTETTKTTATEPPGTVATTKTTNELTTQPQSATYPTSSSTMNQGGNKGVTEKTTVTVTSQSQAGSKVPAPTGNTGTTISPSTVTKAGPTTSENSGTKAVTMSLQTAATSTTAAQPQTFSFSLNKGTEATENKALVGVCQRLMVNLNEGTCSMTFQNHSGTLKFVSVDIKGTVSTSQASQYYEEITKSPTDNKTLIAILASCGALLIMIVILAVCASHHRKPYNENQQHLTEELHTVENGYHDNPTLEVMEVQPEMQEKKMALNGEFNDSWIVPIDNLLKEDTPDEEDTHL